MAKIISRHFNMNHYSKFISKRLSNNHINGPKFSTTSNTNCLLFERLSNNRLNNILSLLTYPNTETETETDVVENIDLTCLMKDFESLKIHGHSHGIVCLYRYLNGDNILLCNPVTREFHKLPPVIEPHEDGIKSDIMGVGFGYDQKSNDFKVVRISKALVIEVYNLSTDRWREIKTRPVFNFSFHDSFAMYHNGVCYWWAYSGGTKFLLSFDIIEEVFNHILLPDRFMYRSFEHKSLGVWNGSVVLFHYPTRIDEKHIEVWTLEKNEYGEILWSKLPTIGPVSGIQYVVMFVNSDELVMVDKDGQVISYNINTKEVKNLPLKGEPEEVRFFNQYKIIRGFVFEKSLMSVKGGSRFDLEAVSETI